MGAEGAAPCWGVCSLRAGVLGFVAQRLLCLLVLAFSGACGRGGPLAETCEHT